MTMEMIRVQRVARRQSDPANSYHCDGIPVFAEAELARLYGHIHSSVAFFETSRIIYDAKTYISHENHKISAVIIFRIEGKCAEILNEFICLNSVEIQKFSDYIFCNFRSVHAIRFHAIQADTGSLPYPSQRHNSKENWVITLPRTPTQYTDSLGKATREKIKRYSKKILKDFPSLSYEFYENEEIQEEHIRTLIKLSQARITSKKKPFGIDEDETKRIIRLAKRCGVVNVARIDGRLCAGMITYRVGFQYLTEVIAHDPNYNEYRLGTLCYHRTICESIARGAKKFHMGGGREDYKAHLLGVRQDMDRLLIYRSYAHMALSPCLVAKTAADGCVRRMKVWLLAHEKSLVTQAVYSFLFLLRKLRLWLIALSPLQSAYEAAGWVGALA